MALSDVRAFFERPAPRPWSAAIPEIREAIATTERLTGLFMAVAYTDFLLAALLVVFAPNRRMLVPAAFIAVMGAGMWAFGRWRRGTERSLILNGTASPGKLATVEAKTVRGTTTYAATVEYGDKDKHTVKLTLPEDCKAPAEVVVLPDPNDPNRIAVWHESWFQFGTPT